MIVIFVDQLTKWSVASRPERWPNGFAGMNIRIRQGRHLHGIQRHLKLPGLVMLWALLVGTIVVLTQETSLFQHQLARLGLGAAVGGAAGNLWDRVRRGAVIDFVDLGWWPVFNFADVAITAGAVLALWFGVRG